MDTVAKGSDGCAFRLVHPVERELGSPRIPNGGCPVSVSITQYKNFVGGEWVDAASGETMEVLNPSTGEVIAEVPRAGAEDVERALRNVRGQ